MIAHNFALPFLDSENLFGNLYLYVFFDFYLATQAPLGLLLLTGEETNFGRENLSATACYTAFTHSACSATAACRRKENLFVT
ncbi:hypothetical protein SDC9_134827 [bioreactor metagenome]|uniref:Uncharacterized protein n=1 Tax=bioreactor metagenome TaxID=1076179 RepID=A0A645DEN4_9ZZZZ